MITAIQERHLRLSDDKAYYAKRWYYMSAAIRVAGMVADQVSEVIEIGPYQVPMFHESIVIDRKPLLSRAAFSALRPKAVIEHDITVAPWPIHLPRAPRLAVALQVWEHLEGRQAQAFEELRRNADYGLLSFPFEWKTADPKDCHRDVTVDIIDAWTPGAKVLHQEICAKPNPKRKRLIRLYDLR
jgi:hypothetical protein